MDKKILKGFATVLIVAILLSAPLGYAMYKPPIHEVDYNDIMEVYDIGETLAERVILYLESNPSCDIDDLIYVDGIGEIKLKALKEVFR